VREQLLPKVLESVREWEGRFGALPSHPALIPDAERLAGAWEEYAGRMAANFPFFHPRYAGQMLKPPHPVAVAGYLAAMLVNPNNHALDGGPVTSEMEQEVVSDLAAMFGLPGEALGHLTSSGTIANLEALWIARELHPDKGVLFGANAHYTHERMCAVLRMPAERAAADALGHIDLDDVAQRCASGRIGTVVLTTGTTGLGAVDAVHEALALRDRYGVRIHVDAAYGGFFALVAAGEHALVPSEPLRAIAQCDSVVVDPHKHGLQPYGCGAVLFRDAAVGRFYRHDSPYTYFTSGELHLGEISLECSRAGAAAGALWLTLRALPLRANEGLGPILAAGLRAARDWAARIAASEELRLHVDPELDIVTYFPAAASAAAVDTASAAVLAAGMADAGDPIYLSTLRIAAADFTALHSDLPAGDDVRVLRSVLMKPEHEPYVGALHERVRALARAAAR
jgi:glutamate/tyrosine decarboxylase-like PLP-dependent enzyme